MATIRRTRVRQKVTAVNSTMKGKLSGEPNSGTSGVGLSGRTGFRFLLH